MGTVKAVIGYGIGLAVLGVVLSYVIRAYLRFSKDYVAKMARRDSTRRELRVSADYARTFLGATLHPVDDSIVGGVGTGSSTDPGDNASDQRPHLTLLDPPPTPVAPPPTGDALMTITTAPSAD